MGKPVRFRINDNSGQQRCLVGIYHPSSRPNDQLQIGKQKQQWEWLRDLDREQRIIDREILHPQLDAYAYSQMGDTGYTKETDFAVKPKFMSQQDGLVHVRTSVL